MSRVGKQALIVALERRFDFQSARNVLKRALKETGLGDDYSAAELGTLSTALEAEADRMEGVVARLKELAATAEAKPAAKKEAKAKEAAVKKEAPAKAAAAEEAPAKEAEAEKEAPSKEDEKAKPAARSRRRRKKTT